MPRTRATPKASLDAMRDEQTAAAILDALRRHDCYRREAARDLGRSEAWLYDRIRRLGLGDRVRRLEREAGRRTWAPGRPKRANPDKTRGS